MQHENILANSGYMYWEMSYFLFLSLVIFCVFYLSLFLFLIIGIFCLLEINVKMVMGLSAVF